MELLDLNDDCLDHVLGFLDLKSVCSTSDSCKRLRQIAERIFKKHKSYKCDIGDEVSVKESWKILRKIGQHLTVLRLEFYTIDSELYVESGIGCKFLSLLNGWLGEKFRELELNGQISSISVSILAPTFLKLEKLSFYCDYSDNDGVDKEYFTMSMDLPHMSPNLQALRIENVALHFAPNRKKSFQNLLTLEFLSFGSYYPVESFVSFIGQNKHLRRLHVDNYDNDTYNEYIDLAGVANLKDLQELRIRTVVFYNYTQALRDFNGLHHLTTLVMTEYWDDVEQMNEILGILKRMTQLEKLWLGFCYIDAPNQQSIVNISIELKGLESFKIDCKCDCSTIMEFVRSGPKLKTLRVERGKDRVVTTRFIKDLAKVRESIANADHQPLVVYFHNAKLNGDVSKVLKEPSIERFLKWNPMDAVGSNPFEHYPIA